MRQEACLDLSPQDKEDKPLPRAIYKDLTKDATDTVSCSVREFGVVCVLPKTKKREQNTSVENAKWGCVLPHVLRYITPNYF